MFCNLPEHFVVRDSSSILEEQLLYILTHLLIGEEGDKKQPIPELVAVGIG
ncbi:MAG: hypothetical protein J5629_10610 [Muribaculaceae bacterium]|nr:hypothetical protein [Muribaculaceae bacterium]